MEGGTSPEAESNAGENSEAEESLDGDPIEMCVRGLRAMLQVSSDKAKVRRGWNYGR